MVTVSVIVPCYNAEKYLMRNYESLKKQSFQDFEVIYVNDGSTDDTLTVLTGFQNELGKERVKVFSQENGGLSKARNVAFPLVEGKYLTFLDADDYYDSLYLEVLVNKAEIESLDVVCSGQIKVTNEGEILKTISYKVKNNSCYQRRLNISGKLYRTEYINKWKLTFPEGKTYEDNSFNLQALYLSSKIGFLEYVGYHQLVHEGSITSKRIDPNRLPFDEWKRVAAFVHSTKVDKVDIEHFDFIFMSFLTYFLMIRNRKREYLTNEEKVNDMKAVYVVTQQVESIIISEFKNFNKNVYTKLLSSKGVPFVQKVGTRVVFFFAKREKLKTLVNIVYGCGK